VVQLAHTAVEDAARVRAMMIFFISVLQLKFGLIWVTVVLHCNASRHRLNDVILRCLANDEQTVCHMGQSLLPVV
jgi:hypothetical protein